MKWEYRLTELARIVGVPGHLPDKAFRSVSTDTRTLERGDVFFALLGERFDGGAFVPQAFEKGAVCAVTTRACDAGPCVVVDDPLAALQQFGAHHRSRYDIPLIALTGSCGKTMSKDLAAAVLSTRYVVVKTPGNLNNAIGCPLSLLCIDDNTDVAVIELGANHVGEIAALCKLARPTESAITMVAPAHLEGFGTVEQVAEAKAEIVDALPGDGVFYVNADDPRCVRIAERHAGPQVSYGKQGDVVLECCEPVGGGEMRLTVQPVGDLRLPLVCRAHATNVLLAAAIGLNHGVEEFESPLRDALAVSPRFRVLRIGPFEVIDDTYNANPASTAAALQTLGERSGGPRIAVLGEMLELGDAAKVLHEQVGMLAGGVGVTHLFARGPHAAVMSAAARAAGVQQAECIEDHGEIAEAIRALERPGAVVLVKGSRGMAMEHVIEALRRYYP